MPQKTQFQAIVAYKCPRCREGDMFKHSLVKIRQFDQMNKNCPVCNLHFEPEPGFYFGAMYISYAFSVALFVTVALILYVVFGDPDLWVYAVAIPSAVVILLPGTFRLSRSIFLHVFGGIGYDPDYVVKK